MTNLYINLQFKKDVRFERSIKTKSIERGIFGGKKIVEKTQDK